MKYLNILFIKKLKIINFYRLLLRVSIEVLYKSKWEILNLVLERILKYIMN